MATSTPHIPVRQQHLELVSAFELSGFGFNIIAIGKHRASSKFFVAPLDISKDKPIQENDVCCYWGLKTFQDALRVICDEHEVVNTADYLIVHMPNLSYLES